MLTANARLRPESPPPESAAVAAQRDNREQPPPRASPRLAGLARRVLRARGDPHAATDSIDAVLAGIQHAVELAGAPAESRIPSSLVPHPADAFLAWEGEETRVNSPSQGTAREPGVLSRRETKGEKEDNG